ncbi:MAG: DUF4012 domain-containing protein [Chloroflexi bacterium]|nr:DUF4012 domain-containing protein [Chloroflexota bacterium]
MGNILAGMEGFAASDFLRIGYFRHIFAGVIISSAMQTSDYTIESLKKVLDDLRDPQALDSHPWAARKLTVDPVYASQDPGRRLVLTLIHLFREMKPPMPPKRGKRLDTRWGEFGLLAAYYFAPIVYGAQKPSSLREAWQSIDRAILLFVFGSEDVTQEERVRYRLVGDEPGIASDSTISDWHRKGLERFIELISQEENRLESQPVSMPHRPRWKLVTSVIALLVLTALTFGVLKGWGFYQRAVTIKQKVDALEKYLSPFPKADEIGKIAPLIHDLRNEVNALKMEASPFLGVTPYLGWVPTYGGDIVQAPDLLEMANELAIAADEGVQALQPSLETALQKDQAVDIPAILQELQEVEPKLLSAQVALTQAQAARDRIDSERLSPYLKKLIEARIDPLLESIAGKQFQMEDALALVHSAPRLLGVGKVGPQTYLLLIQNEDELRPTGGYLTAVGSVVVKDGKLLSINIESSEQVDDLTKPYPNAPWQLDKYMAAEILMLRDSNWFTDFRTSAEWAEYLYSYSRAYSVDGVIAINQHVVVEILKTIGPIRVEGVNFDITSQNVLSYMRSAKESRPRGVAGEWDRKQFIGRLAKPLLEKILGARGSTWSSLGTALIQLLDERHILLQFDDPETTALLARRAWDGAVRPPQNSDFLMVVDSNIGFNKSNTLLATALNYKVDLTSPTAPLGNLTVSHTNKSQSDSPCVPRLDAIGTNMSEVYTMDACHFTYLRVYNPAGTQLRDATLQAIPAEQTLREIPVPAQVDLLKDDGITAVQAFGALVVIPQKNTIHTSFVFSLPSSVIQQNSASRVWTYRLTVQKQPGTIAIPLTITLRLPDKAELTNSPAGLQREQDKWVFETGLKKDVVFEIIFRVSP